MKNKLQKYILHFILQFIDSARLMARSLSNLVNNPSDGIHKFKCKNGHKDKKCETCGITYKYCNCLLEQENVKVDLIEHECLLSNKNHQHKFE